MDDAAKPSTTRAGKLIGLMRSHPLSGFFLLAFASTWVWEVLVFGVLGLPMGNAALTVGSFVGPTLAAFLMAMLTEGRTGVRRLLRRYVRWRFSPLWYPVVLLGLPLATLLGLLIRPGALTAFQTPTLAFGLSYLAVYLLILVFGGPLGEEPGWRGFALPRLQHRLGPLPGTLVLGALHALWHLPLYLLLPGYNGAPADLPGAGVSFGLFLVGVTAEAVLLSWVFNNTRGSLLPVMLLHASANTLGVLVMEVFPTLEMDLVLARLPVQVAVALLIVVATRGGLGYQRYRREEGRMR